ncbi:alpha/beta hydrolase [Sneathiella marina]|uniref:Alpha/beta hydrolase n=1 Tax=Sneathiella marina TaxID=2950108 RepID=A0ABY4W0Y2_9PROT|nr:alpha/beta hydrolase [Sneathiella marina]USG60860.1 alpha/beta hydrolase [Sneathiella marina]
MTYTDFTTAPVMALHGSASSSKQWQSLCEILEDRFHVITPDLPGYGDRPATGSQKGFAADADPIIQEIEELGQPVHLVGHSYGGAVAMKVAILRPDLLVSLTVYEPVLFCLLRNTTDQNQKFVSEMEAVAKSLQNAIAMNTPESGMATFIDYWNGEGTWQQLPTTAREKFVSKIDAVAQNFVRSFEETVTLQDLAIIDVPTMMMVGLESREVTQQISSMIAQVIPNAKLALMPGLDHMAPVDASEWVNPRIFHHMLEVEQYRVTGVEALRWVA